MQFLAGQQEFLEQESFNRQIQVETKVWKFAKHPKITAPKWNFWCFKEEIRQLKSNNRNWSAGRQFQWRNSGGDCKLKNFSKNPKLDIQSEILRVSKMKFDQLNSTNRHFPAGSHFKLKNNLCKTQLISP